MMIILNEKKRPIIFNYFSITFPNITSLYGYRFESTAYIVTRKGLVTIQGWVACCDAFEIQTDMDDSRHIDITFRLDLQVKFFKKGRSNSTLKLEKNKRIRIYLHQELERMSPKFSVNEFLQYIHTW